MLVTSNSSGNVEVLVVGMSKESSIVSIQDRHPGVQGAQAFQVQVLLNGDFSHSAVVLFRTLSGLEVRKTLGDLINQRLAYETSSAVVATFWAKVNAVQGARVLRSGAGIEVKGLSRRSFPMLNT